MRRFAVFILCCLGGAQAQPTAERVASLRDSVREHFGSERGLAFADEIVGVSRAAGYARGVGVGRYERAMQLGQLGDPAAIPAFRSAVEAARAAGDPITEGQALVWWGASVTETGEAGDGIDLVRRGVGVLDGVGTDEARRDGVALTRALKEDPRTSHVPVLLLTARTDGRVAGFEAGADGYLSKPFDPEALRAQAKALVTERRRLRDAFARQSDRNGLAGGPGDRLATTKDSAGDGRDTEPAPPVPTLAPLDREFVRRVDARIEEEVGNGAFGATQLADDLGLSERQLRRKLKAVTGETPGARIRRLRVEAGGALLTAGTHTVKEAAAAVGYADAEGFRRALVGVTGRQPSDVQAAG